MASPDSRGSCDTEKIKKPTQPAWGPSCSHRYPASPLSGVQVPTPVCCVWLAPSLEAWPQAIIFWGWPIWHLLALWGAVVLLFLLGLVRNTWRYVPQTLARGPLVPFPAPTCLPGSLSPGHRHVLTWPVMKTWEQVSSRAQNWVQELEAGASAIDYQAKWKLKTNCSLNWYGSTWNKCQKLRREYGEFLSLHGPRPQTLPAYFSCQLPGPPSNLLTGVQFPVRFTHWERERETVQTC